MFLASFRPSSSDNTQSLRVTIETPLHCSLVREPSAWLNSRKNSSRCPSPLRSRDLYTERTGGNTYRNGRVPHPALPLHVARTDLNRRPTVHPAAGRQQKKTKQTKHLNFFKTQWVLARVAPDRAVPDRVAPAFTFSRRAALDRATPPIRFAFASVRSV